MGYEGAGLHWKPDVLLCAASSLVSNKQPRGAGPPLLVSEPIRGRRVALNVRGYVNVSKPKKDHLVPDVSAPLFFL